MSKIDHAGAGLRAASFFCAVLYCASPVHADVSTRIQNAAVKTGLTHDGSSLTNVSVPTPLGVVLQMEGKLYTKSHAPKEMPGRDERASELSGYKSGERRMNVFINDRRTESPSTGIPFSAVGRLETPGGGWCSASLVGADLILTAAHCVIDESTHRLAKGKFVFHPGYKNGAAKLSSGAEHFWWGTTDPDEERDQDWAILRIDRRLGDTVGWFGVEVKDLHRSPSGYEMVAYSMDFKKGSSASFEKDCSFKNYDPSGFFLHDCDASRGSSGAPMFYFPSPDQHRIVALNAAERRDHNKDSLINIPYSDAHANIAVPSSAFLPTLLQILAKK